MVEGIVGSPEIMHRLSKREVEVEAVLVRKPRCIERRVHRRDIRVVELHRLEVGEAPPRIAKRGFERDRLPVRANAVRLPPTVLSMCP